MERIRVIVADDSAFMRKIITDILERDKRIEVISTARNGKDALNKIEQYSPDVVTMDVQMPIMDGLQALGIIMKTNPLPVVMVSGETDQSRTIEAMAKGAVDFIQKPSGQISLNMDDIKKEVIDKVIAAASIDKKGKQSNYHLKLQPTKKLMKITNKDTVVAIGTSTGGPRALSQVIGALPTDYKFPIFIVQHMPSGFTKSLADRLNMNCDVSVKEAEDGEKVKPKMVYIAPGNQHLKVKKNGDALYIELSTDEPRNGHRPSVDVLLESLAEITELNKVAVILTGMGNDGAKGVTRLKAASENTMVIAESEESAIIYGMPKAVINMKKADYILPLEEVGRKLIQLQD